MQPGEHRVHLVLGGAWSSEARSAKVETPSKALLACGFANLAAGLRVDWARQYSNGGQSKLASPRVPKACEGIASGAGTLEAFANANR